MKNEDLAELIGILFGDGKIYESKRHGYQIQIWCNFKDEVKYVNYISQLLFKLFGKVPSLYSFPEKSTYCIQLSSKSAVTELLSLGVPKKHGDMKIPNWIVDRNELSKRFLRGIFDSDGCFVLQKDGKYRYILLKVSMKSRFFAEEIKRLLDSLSFHSYISSKGKIGGFDVVIRNKKDVSRWMSEIGSCNQKNIDKYSTLLDAQWGH